MSDTERDPLIGAALDQVGREVAGHIRPAGAAAAVSTLRRRRRRRQIAGGALAAIMILGPAATLGASQYGPDPGPRTAGSTTPEPSASGPGPVAVAPPRSSAAPDPGIPAAEILNGTLTLPPWPAGLPGSESCRSGAVRFTNGTSTEPYHLTIVGRPAYVDVDRDGGPESLVLIRCSPQAAVFQVLVYDRARGGPIRLLGQVLATPAGSAREGVDILFVHAAEPTADGQIRVDVGDYSPCCDTALDLPQHQWRTYGWTGQRFTQTGGPTAFGPNPKLTDLSVSGRNIAMTAQADGTWRGWLTVRLVNAGPKVANANLILDTPDGVTLGGPARAGCTTIASRTECRFAGLAAGAMRTVTVDVVSAAAPAGVVHAAAVDDDAYPDRAPDDNGIDLRITAA
jgi:hypothetical protein